MSCPAETKLGTFSTLSIGIGGMVGGGIFAVTGLTIEITKGAAPLAFLISGVVALLTSYSYLKLTLRFPGEGGTVDFLNRAFGSGIVTGAANILLLFSYVVLVAVYAYAFGSYGAGFFPAQDVVFWRHVLISAAIVGLVVLNVLSTDLVIRSENLFNSVKMLLLIAFVVVGLLTPMEWSRLGPDNFVTPMGLVAGAMLIFLNYEGFELIANASQDVANPKRSLPIAYIGGVLIVIAIYVLIVTVVVGHVSFAEAGKDSDRALSLAAHDFAGRAGYTAIAIAALLATSSAINATFYSTGRLTYIIAKTGELPRELERSIRGQHLEGTLIAAALALIVANFVPLEAIATMGSAGFLLLFMAVNIANVRLARETSSHAWLSGLAALSTAVALVMLCVEVEENPATRNHLWILVGMIVVSFAIEIAYRVVTGRKMRWLVKMSEQLQAIVTVLSLVNPAICAAMFANATAGRTFGQKMTDATKAAMAILIILSVAALIGTQLLHLFGVSLDAFMVAGGGVLAWMGFSMLSRQPDASPARAGDSNATQSLTPLIMFAASPGTITGVITLSAAHTRLKLPVTALVAIAVATGCTWLVMLLVARLGGKPGGGGFLQDTLTRFMGLLVLSMGVQFALTGYFAFAKGVTGGG